MRAIWFHALCLLGAAIAQSTTTTSTTSSSTTSTSTTSSSGTSSSGTSSSGTSSSGTSSSGTSSSGTSSSGTSSSTGTSSPTIDLLDICAIFNAAAEGTDCTCVPSSSSKGGATIQCVKTTPQVGLTPVTIPSITFTVDTQMLPCASPASITASGSIDLPGTTSDTLTDLINTAAAQAPNGDLIEFDGTTNKISISSTVTADQPHTIDVPVFKTSVGVGTVEASYRYIIELTISGGALGMALSVDFCIKSTIPGFNGEKCGADLWTSVKTNLGNPPYKLFEATGMDMSSYCSAPDDGDDPCFDSSATVTLENGTVTRLDKLKGTDNTIIAADSNGALTKGKLSFLSHSDSNVRATFVVLSTEDGRTLTLTPQHHVPTGSTCCARLKQAKEIVVGETVWTAGAGALVATPSTVRTVSKTVATGLHSPVLTNGAFPIVNGVVTAFDSFGKVTLASYGLSTLEMMCKVTGTCHLIAAVMKNREA